MDMTEPTIVIADAIDTDSRRYADERGGGDELFALKLQRAYLAGALRVIELTKTEMEAS